MLSLQKAFWKPILQFHRFLAKVLQLVTRWVKQLRLVLASNLGMMKQSLSISSAHLPRPNLTTLGKYIRQCCRIQIDPSHLFKIPAFQNYIPDSCLHVTVEKRKMNYNSGGIFMKRKGTCCPNSVIFRNQGIPIACISYRLLMKPILSLYINMIKVHFTIMLASIVRMLTSSSAQLFL